MLLYRSTTPTREIDIITCTIDKVKKKDKKNRKLKIKLNESVATMAMTEKMVHIMHPTCNRYFDASQFIFLSTKF